MRIVPFFFVTNSTTSIYKNTPYMSHFGVFYIIYNAPYMSLLYHFLGVRNMVFVAKSVIANER